MGDLGQDPGGLSLRVTGQEARKGRQWLMGASPAPALTRAASPVCPQPCPSCPVPVGQSASAACHSLSTHVASLRPSRGEPNVQAGPSTMSGRPRGWGLAGQRSLGRRLLCG